MVRVKHRYLVAQILYPEPFSKKSATELPALLEFHRPTPGNITAAHMTRFLRDTIATYFGDHGAGACASSLAVKYFSPATSTLIIRCARERVRLVWAALTFITHLPLVHEGRYRAGSLGPPCVIRVVRCSGAIRKSEEKVIEMARADILRAKSTVDGSIGGMFEEIATAGLGSGIDAIFQESGHDITDEDEEDKDDSEDMG